MRFALPTISYTNRNPSCKVYTVRGKRIAAMKLETSQMYMRKLLAVGIDQKEGQKYLQPWPKPVTGPSKPQS